MGKWQNQKSGWRLRKIQLNPRHSWKKICQRFGPRTKIEKSSGDFWGYKGTAQPLGLEILRLRILNFSQSSFAICNHQYIFARTLSGCCFGRFGYGRTRFCLTYHRLMLLFNVRIMAVQQFSSKGTKLERFLPKNQHTQRKLLNFEDWVNAECQKVPKVKNYPNLSHFFFFIEEYQFRSTFFVVAIYW